MVVVILLLIAAAIAAVWYVMAKPGATFGDSSVQQKTVAFFTFIGSAALAVIFTMTNLYYIVSPGHVGVEVLFGKVQKFGTAGLNFKNPFSEVVDFSIRTVKYSMPIDGASQDLQEVKATVSINYRLDFKRISKLFTEVGKDFQNIVIAPAVLNITKAAISKFPIEDVIVRRTDLADLVQTNLAQRLDDYYIILENVNFENIDFTTDFKQTVEQKQIEQQKIKTAEYIKDQAKQTAEQTVIVAKAEAEKNLIEARAEAEKQRLLRNSTSTEVIALKWIEAWKAGGSQVPKVVTSGKQGNMYMMDLGNVTADGGK